MDVQGGGFQLNGALIRVGDPQPGGLLQGSNFQPEGTLFCGPRVVIYSTRPWCELCKVHFNPGDLIVRLGSDGSVSSTSRFENKIIRCDSHGNPQAFGPTFQDRLPYPWAHSYHSECANGGVKAEVISPVLDKVWYSYVPTMTEFKRRQNWLQMELSNNLARSEGALTGDVGYQTAGLCLTSLITAYAMSTRDYHDTEITSFRVDGDIWARLVKFEGKEYIACLMNSPPPPPEDRASFVVKLRKPEGPVKALYIAFDYLGIRKLVIGVDDEPPSISPEEGLWWLTMSVDGDTFTCQSDGMKLRQIKPAAALEFLSWSHCWATPQPPDKYPCLKQIRTNDSLAPARVKSVECNLPSITGYSVRWTSQLSSIHAHVRGEEDFAFYDELKRKPQRAVWLYMPMDEGELIEQFCLRSDREYSHTSTALIMKTDRGRVWEAGPRPDPGIGGPLAWTCISQSTERQHLFFDQSFFGISALGFQHPLPDLCPAREEPQLEVPQPESAPGQLLASEQCFYTSASLDGVASISICKKKKARKETTGEKKSTPNITGLLFTYQDGRQRSVGHVRLDWLQRPTEIGDSRGIAFKLSEDREKVVDLTVGDHAAEEGGEFIPWGGRLAWWFSVNRCELIHERDDPSLETPVVQEPASGQV
ncbi:unnamed protein product [Clonostachys rhizophaga]|uniref:Uncharacterized protein n=1 Tax=Clonostachys rhizophaga TaxID=160324 RepID=A0A9N9VG57_9HYPO|nr:unnamed protein product [Clonostachys rhizophaga]